MPTNTDGKRKSRVIDLLYSAFFAVLIAVCSWISVPTLIPFTLQTFGVFCALVTLGGKRGTVAILVYILLGTIGIPVFSNFSGGIGVILGTTGGYIVGFLLTGLIYWLITALLSRKLWVECVALILGLAAVYAFGTIWYMLVYARQSGTIGIGTALGMCVVPFILPDAIKMVSAVVLSRRMRKLLK